MLISLVAKVVPQLLFGRRCLAAGIPRSAMVVRYFIWAPVVRLAMELQIRAKLMGTSL